MSYRNSERGDYCVRRQGFTLIELLVSTSIIVLMLAMSLPSFITFQRRQNLTNAADQVRDAILETNNYALAPRGSGSEGEKDPGADQYRILFLPGETYQIEEQRYDAANPTLIDWQSLKTSKLSNRLKFCDLPAEIQATSSTLGPDKGIIYSIRQLGKIVHPEIGSTITISLGYEGTRTSKDIIIQRETGQVEVNDSTADCT
jgi:prepilin-type N-terminal cleavage/methylation domain-containing protein